jgi:cytoskeleton protein RodZ
MKEGVLMSDETLSDNSQAQVAMPVAALSAGQMLRTAREAAGLHIAALAVSLKVPVKKLEALEAEQFDQLPDAVFVRALASSVARALKIDPAPILAKLPQTNAPRLHQTAAAINTPFRDSSQGPGPSVFTSLSRPAVLAVLALLLGALVIIFFPKRDASTDTAIMPPSGLVGAAATGLAPSGTEPSSVLSKAPAGESAAMQSAVLSAHYKIQNSTSGSASTTGVIGLTAANSMPQGITDAASITSTLAITSVVKSTPTVASPTLVVSANAPPPPLPKDGIVVFSSIGESWVEVIDSKGTIVLRRTMQAGETIGASGALPLNVVVGRSGQTKVSVRGKPYDMSDAKEGVARFVVR